MTRATIGAGAGSMVPTWVVVLALPLLALTTSCRSESQPPPQTQTPGPSATSAASATPEPSPSSTATPVDPVAAGVEALERAVLSGDEEAVLARVMFSAVPCSNDTWPMPVCEPGEPEGTTIQRLPFVGCEAVFLTEEDLRTVLGQVLFGRKPSVYARLTASGVGEAPLFPLGPIGLVFETQPPPGVIHPTGLLAVLDADGKVISLRTGCRATPQGLVESLPDAKPLG